MIVAKAPFRISFVGGGTDFEDYYRLVGGMSFLRRLISICT